MAQSLKTVNAITLFVEDQQRSKEFYERVFEVAAADEQEGTVIFKFDNYFLRLLTRGEAEKEMLGQVPLADSDSAASFQLAAFVDDVDALCSRARQAGSLVIYGPVNRRLGCAQRGLPRPRRPHLGIQRRHPED